MDFSSGIPITRVLGRVDREKRVMAHSRLPLLEKLAQQSKTTKIKTLETPSAAMKRRSILYGIILEINSMDRSGTAK
jgi:hypothetical protein